MLKTTRELAYAAAYDAGERSARRAGRKAWNVDDYNVVVRTFDRLWPVERDMSPRPDRQSK